MAPKKGQKMSLSTFLEDSTLGSWADEMDSLPTAPAARTDEERARMGERGYNRGDRDFGTRPDRAAGPPREELPLPTEPPYTAFIGNLPFDLSETELGEFFTPLATKSVKIIKDRDDKPKGFGYIEFEDLEGLKEALAKSGSSFQNRAIRISVAAPPQKGTGGFDDEKMAGPWRRDGPLAGGPMSRGRNEGGGDRDRFREDKDSSIAEGASDWRSSRAPQTPQREDRPPRRSGFSTPVGGDSSAADSADNWTIGSKFKPAAGADSGAPRGGRFGSVRSDRGGGDFGSGGAPRREVTSDMGDWRSATRTPSEKSPSNSTPPTPQMGRRKLELMPRTSSQGSSQVNSPLGSPKLSSAGATPRPNPFGAAKPVDVAAREAEVAERLEREREELAKSIAEKPMSRNSSRTARDRPLHHSHDASATSPTVTSPADTVPAPTTPPKAAAAAAAASVVRPSFSFASAAGAGKAGGKSSSPGRPLHESVQEDQKEGGNDEASDLPQKVEELSV